jgi:hypothetical protein
MCRHVHLTEAVVGVPGLGVLLDVEGEDRDRVVGAAARSQHVAAGKNDQRASNLEAGPGHAVGRVVAPARQDQRAAAVVTPDSRKLPCPLEEAAGRYRSPKRTCSSVGS